MKSVLIISPYFPPVNTPDHQRIRMLLPHFRDCGWNPVVLAVNPMYIQAPLDHSQQETIPDDIPIHHVNAWSPRFTRLFKFDNLAKRSFGSLRKEGNRLLSESTFDLVFFSTTQKEIFLLGPYWLKKFSIPFAVDIQDPLVNDHYHQTNTPPPGGELKFLLSQRLGKRIEQQALTKASLLVTVSSDYIDNIRERVPQLDTSLCHTLPFPYSERDLQMAKNRTTPVWARAKHGNVILSAGRAGADLILAQKAFFLALEQWEHASKYTVHFVGTAYGNASDSDSRVLPLARHLKSRIPVTETPQRQPLLDVLKAQQNVALNCIFGSTDTRYNASKLLPVLRSGQPVLAILHQDSPAARFMQEVAPHYLCSFTNDERPSEIAEHIAAKLISILGNPKKCSLKSNALNTLDASCQARHLGTLFSNVLKDRQDAP